MSIDNFFFLKNTINEVTDNDFSKLNSYIAPIKAFSRLDYKSIYIIDYATKSFEYVSENPLFLCGLTSEKVLNMGYSFYLKYVPKEDLEMLLKINRLGFEFYDERPLEDKMKYAISYDFKLKATKNRTILINHKLTPLFLTEKGKIWKAICLVSLSTNFHSGNVKFYKYGENVIHNLNLQTGYWSKSQKISLSKREREVLLLSAQGYTVKEISEKLFLSISAIKFHRSNLIEKLEVSNITEAVLYAVNNKLL